MDRPLLVASLLLAALMFGLVWEFIGDAPPDRVQFAAGPRDGGYYALAQRLAERVRRHGVEVDVLETNGARENLERMAKPDGPMLGLIQGGTRVSPDIDTSRLRTLATVDLEPVWIFQRPSDTPITSLDQFEGARILGGRTGSGTHDLLEFLLEKASVEADITDLSNVDAERAFLAGDGSLLFSVVRWDDQGWVADLLKTGKASFVQLQEAPALERTVSFLSVLDIPRGAIDLRRPHPDENLKILATATNLVVRADAHVATKALFIEELQAIDHGTRLLGTYGRFPNVDYADQPVDEDAARILKEGQSFIRRYLPYWLATEVERFYALLLPLATLALPLWRLIPGWFEKRRAEHIEKLYRKLQELDLAITAAEDHPAEMRTHLSRLDHFERDLTLIHRKTLSVAKFSEFRRDIDRIRFKAHAMSANAHWPERMRESDAASLTTAFEPGHLRDSDDHTHGPERLLAELQSNLDALAAVETTAQGSNLPSEFKSEVAAMRAHLVNARRTLLHITQQLEETTAKSPTSRPPTISERVTEISLNGPGRTQKKADEKAPPAMGPAHS